MPKYFVDPAEIKEKEILLEGEDAEHINRVLRSRVGDEIIVCDGQCKDYRCIITELNKRYIRTEIQGCAACESEPLTEITLFQGLPKGDKLELIIQKAVELGVSRIVPVAMKRSVTRLAAEKSGKKQARWQKIALSAAMQSGRGRIPTVTEPIEYSAALEEAAKLSDFFLAYEEEREYDVKAFLRTFSGKSLGFFVGPEGGFEDEEVQAAKELNGKAVTLGRRILRTETAGMAVLAILFYELG